MVQRLTNQCLKKIPLQDKFVSIDKFSVSSLNNPMPYVSSNVRSTHIFLHMKIPLCRKTSSHPDERYKDLFLKSFLIHTAENYLSEKLTLV